VVTAAHRDALAVKVVADLFGAESIHHEGKYAGLFFRRADDVQSWNRCNAAVAYTSSMCSWRETLCDADAIEIIDRCAQTNRVGDVAGAGFKSLRRRLIERLLEGDVLDHVAAALPGGMLSSTSDFP
jgi:hypothetical protein